MGSLRNTTPVYAVVELSFVTWLTQTSAIHRQIHFWTGISCCEPPHDDAFIDVLGVVDTGANDNQKRLRLELGVHGILLFYYMTERSFPRLHRGPMLYLGRGRQSTLSFPGDSSVPLIIENDSWLPEQSDNGFVLLLLLISATTFACKYFAQKCTIQFLY